MSKGKDISYEQLPNLIEFFQKHRYSMPVVSVMPRDRNDSKRNAMDSIAFQWNKEYDINDTMSLSSIMSQFHQAIANMPDERRKFIVNEIKKYRDLENPRNRGISGSNKYAFNKSKVDGRLYRAHRRR